MFIPWIDGNVAMRVDEKSLLTHILEQVAIVQTISFLLGSPVNVGVVQEEDDFFFFHNDLLFRMWFPLPAVTEVDCCIEPGSPGSWLFSTCSRSISLMKITTLQLRNAFTRRTYEDGRIRRYALRRLSC